LWLTDEVKKNAFGQTLYSRHWEYDEAGNRLRQVATGREVIYTYDDNNKLVSSTDGVTYGWDDNGNMVSRTQGGQTVNYTYSYENKMTNIYYPNGSRRSFGYDGDGVRRWKEEVGALLALPRTNYIYDGSNLAAEFTSGWTLQAAYTDGSGGLLRMYRGTASRFYHFDGLGSTWYLTGSTGTTTDSYAYDAWGNILSQTGATTNPYRYVGELGYYHDDTGLLLLGERYYDPTTGRFTTGDPIQWQRPGYSYAESNPVNHSDPLGLLVLPPEARRNCPNLGDAIWLLLHREGKAPAAPPADRETTPWCGRSLTLPGHQQGNS